MNVHEDRFILVIAFWIIGFCSFCGGCDKEEVTQETCTYTAEGLQNYVWDIQADGMSMFIPLPKPTFNASEIQDDLNLWLDDNGTATVTIENPNRNFEIRVDSTTHVFEWLILAGDIDGNNRDTIPFAESDCL